MRWLLAVLCLACSAPASAEKKTVVVELYTSQGCSSCPPADRLLPRLDALAGDIDVIPLAFHVDYWNYIGWRDPLSSKRWSTRQRRYGSKIAGGRIYTPQLVISGQKHVVGSRRSAALRAIRAAARSMKPFEARAKVSGKQLAVRATSPEGARLFLVVFENDIETRVTRGENAGRMLENDYVVRALVPLRRGAARVALERGWKRSRLGAVVIAQEPKSLRIVGARRLPL